MADDTKAATAPDRAVASGTPGVRTRRRRLARQLKLALPGCFGETPYFVTGVRRVQP